MGVCYPYRFVVWPQGATPFPSSASSVSGVSVVSQPKFWSGICGLWLGFVYRRTLKDSVSPARTPHLVQSPVPHIITFVSQLWSLVLWYMRAKRYIVFSFRIFSMGNISSRVQMFPAWHTKAAPNGKCCEGYTGCFTTLGLNCRRWFHRSLWSEKFI